MKLLVRTVATAAAGALSLLTLAAPSHAQPTPAPSPATKTVVADSAVPALRASLRAGTLAQQTSTLALCASAKLLCNAQVLAAKGTSTPLSSTLPIGLGATDLTQAYNLTGTPQAKGTIAIVDAAAYPSASADLAVYRKQYHLPACTKASGCLRVMSYTGGPERTPATTPFGKFIEEIISVETSLDLQMASAACPSCKLVLLQVPPLDALNGTPKHLHQAESHFARAVSTAKKVGATSVSISYGYPADSYSNSGKPAKLIDVRGVAVTASTGDSGFNGPAPTWPANLTTVTAVGGTSLTQSQVSGQWSESAWNGAGSGCTVDLGPAVGQPAAIAAYCSGHRASADISAVADPATGVSVYDTWAPYTHQPYNWISVGGTSASSPFVAGLYSRAGGTSAVHGPNTLYAAPASAFHDVTSGANAPRGFCSSFAFDERVCTADIGWDGPTGRGTPVGLTPFG